MSRGGHGRAGRDASVLWRECDVRRAGLAPSLHLPLLLIVLLLLLHECWGQLSGLLYLWHRRRRCASWAAHLLVAGLHRTYGRGLLLGGRRTGGGRLSLRQARVLNDWRRGAPAAAGRASSTAHAGTVLHEALLGVHAPQRCKPLLARSRVVQLPACARQLVQQHQLALCKILHQGGQAGRGAGGGQLPCCPCVRTSPSATTHLPTPTSVRNCAGVSTERTPSTSCPNRSAAATNRASLAPDSCGWAGVVGRRNARTWHACEGPVGRLLGAPLVLLLLLPGARAPDGRRPRRRSRRGATPGTAGGRAPAAAAWGTP